MTNQLIIQEFEKLIGQIKYELDNSITAQQKSKNLFRLRKIMGSLKIIKRYSKEIVNGNDLKYFKGIGKGTINRINEILLTGRLKEIIIKDNNIKIIRELELVIGIGNKMATQLIKNGITSVQDLKNKVRQGLIKVNDKVMLGLKYYGKYDQQIGRNKIAVIEKHFHKICKLIDSKLQLIICGSYRRGNKFIKDIDVLLVSPKIRTFKQNNYLEQFVSMLKGEGNILDDLVNNIGTKYMGFIKYKDSPIIRLDIRFVPFSSYYPALLYFTGSGNLNRLMRIKARKLGYKLNEYGLFKHGKMIKVGSEKDIFDLLELPYLDVVDRNL